MGDTLRPALFATFVTGVAGSNIALMYIGKGVLAGIDGGTNKYEGTYNVENDNSLSCKVLYTIPAGKQLITGSPLDKDTNFQIEFILPDRFWEIDWVRVETPMGAVNMRFEKMRELP